MDWSSEGDIDAGKGSKTATSAPPPLIRTDSKGNTIVDLSGVVSGSGIGTLQTVAKAAPGNVYLIAPAGTVNAGDAGVRSSGDILVAANAVRGADNFASAGKSSGVPAASSASISFNAPVSADSNSTNKQGDKASDAAKRDANNKLNDIPSLINVEILSVGDDSSVVAKSCSDRKDCQI